MLLVPSPLSVANHCYKLVFPTVALVTAFTCGLNESCGSKVTPRSLGVGLKGSPAMVRERDASFVHVEKKATSLMLAFSPSFARMTSGELPLRCCPVMSGGGKVV